MVDQDQAGGRTALFQVHQAVTDLPSALRNPQISIIGEILDETARQLRSDLRDAEATGGDVAVEVSTIGGNAEIARRMAHDLCEARTRLSGRLLFLGKTNVYSAGITMMSAFPRADRYVTADTWLMIHCRQLDKTIEISGPVRSSLPQLMAAQAQIRTGIAIEEEDFRRLIEGSDIGMDEIMEKALFNWYLSADEALERGLVANIVDPAGKPRLAHRVDGRDDSASFAAGIADEGTIPDTVDGPPARSH